MLAKPLTAPELTAPELIAPELIARELTVPTSIEPASIAPAVDRGCQRPPLIRLRYQSEVLYLRSSRSNATALPTVSSSE